MAGIHLPESDACDSLERGEIDVEWVIQRFNVQGFKCSKASRSKGSKVQKVQVFACSNAQKLRVQKDQMFFCSNAMN